MLLLALSGMILTAEGKRFEYSFEDVAVPQALVALSKEHPDVNIAFIYRELENYRTSARISTDDARTAIRGIVGMNPVSIIEKRGAYYVEAFQHGKYVYRGRVLSAGDDEPVVSGTVLLLAPKDSTVITYGMTDGYGRFTIPCDRKGVLAKVSCLGYATGFKRLTAAEDGDIYLERMPILLNTVTVESADARIYADRTVYVPNERQKNAAQSGGMLLGLMAIPQLDVDLSTMAIKTSAGQNVAVYIDYNEATEQDLDGMRTQDVKRVEYYSYPQDVRFKGARFVVNFIMQQYEYGGYTKVRGEQSLGVKRTEGSIYSKAAYKAMTYDVYADETYFTDRHRGSAGVEIFRFPDLEGAGPMEVARTQRTDGSRFRENLNNVALRALYSGKSLQASNRIGLNVSSTPVNEWRNSTVYEPGIIADGAAEQRQSSKNIAAAYTGDCFLRLSEKSTFQGKVTYNYGRNRSDSRYSGGDGFAITNNAVESVHDLHINPRFSHQLSKHHRVMAYGSVVWRRNMIDYTGSSQSRQVYNVEAYFAGAHYDFISDKIQTGGELGWAFERNRISGTRSSDNFPQVNVYANYTPGEKHVVSAGWNYGKDVPDASQKSPNMLQENELMWYAGTADLRDYKYMNSRVSYTWLPNRRWQMTATGGMYKFTDQIVAVYTPAAPGGAMLRKYVNGGNYEAWMLNVNATAKLLDGRLVVSAIPQYWIFRTSGAYRYSIDDFTGRLQATFYAGGFYFVGSYSLGRKYPATQAEYKERVPAQYHVQAGWGNGSWNVSVGAYNFLRRSRVSGVRSLESEFYDYQRTVYSSGAHMRFGLSATYTFGYGKKVERYDEVEKGEAPESAILK